jgi:hypothetical protein
MVGAADGVPSDILRTTAATATMATMATDTHFSNMLHHLPPRKRLKAQLREQQRQISASPSLAVITGVSRPREQENKNATMAAGMTTTMEVGTLTRPPTVALEGGTMTRAPTVLAPVGGSKKARLLGGGARGLAMFPESDLIREARARAAIAGGEPADTAAAEAKAAARAKGARAIAARQAAVAKAHAAKAAAKAAMELAALAAKAKHKAEELERERTRRRTADAAANSAKHHQHHQHAVALSAVVAQGARAALPSPVSIPSHVKVPPPPSASLGSNKPGTDEEAAVLPSSGAMEVAEESKPLTDEDIARQLHMEINASPRLGRTVRGDRSQTFSPPTSPSPRRHAGPSA